MQQGAGRGLPKPIADLVVKRLDVVGLDDTSVVAQAVVELRAVGLSIDRLQFDALDIRVLFGALRCRMRVETSLSLPDAGERRERSQVTQRVRIGFGFGEDVLRKNLHAVFLEGRDAKRASFDPRFEASLE